MLYNMAYGISKKCCTQVSLTTPYMNFEHWTYLVVLSSLVITGIAAAAAAATAAACYVTRPSTLSLTW